MFRWIRVTMVFPSLLLWVDTMRCLLTLSTNYQHILISIGGWIAYGTKDTQGLRGPQLGDLRVSVHWIWICVVKTSRSFNRLCTLHTIFHLHSGQQWGDQYRQKHGRSPNLWSLDCPHDSVQHVPCKAASSWGSIFPSSSLSYWQVGWPRSRNTISFWQYFRQWHRHNILCLNASLASYRDS